MRGIDVSAYQGKPDWTAVRAAGIEMAIFRAANRKGKDASFEHNYTGCAVAGIQRGVYRYSYAKTVDAAVKEAMEVVRILNGRKLEMGVWLDLEWKEQRALGRKALTAIAKAWIQTIYAAGYTCGIYCNMDWHKNVLDTAALKVPYWIARYPNNDYGTINESLKPNRGECAWQYSSKGRITGIVGNVDLDEWYGTVDMSGKREIDEETLGSLQEALNADGIRDKNGNPLKVDQKKGKLTDSAIQKALMKSGDFDPKRCRYTVGSTGEVVKWLEMRLDTVIGDSIKILLGHTLTEGHLPDGKYGNDVRLAVGLLQELRGLKKDYIAGPKTITELLYK